MSIRYIITCLVLIFLLSACTSQTTQYTDDSVKIIKERGSLIVGSDIPYGVMEFYDKKGEPAGIDVDIAKEIANKLKVKLEFKKYDWDKLFDAVKNKEIDLAISSITITPERSTEMLFSSPYFNGGQTIIIKKENTQIESKLDLKGKNVGAQVDTTGYLELKKILAQENIFEYTAIQDALVELENEKIEAIVVDNIEAITIVKENSNYKIAGEPFTQEFYGIATNLENIALMNEVDSVLREIKRNGKSEEIKNRWIN